MNTDRITPTSLVAALLAAASITHAGAFLSGNDVVIARVGDGVTNYAGSAAPVFLDEYNISGATPVLVNTVPFASAGGSALTESFTTGGRDGYLTLSPNGQYLAFAGYRHAVGGSDPAADDSVTTPRVVGIVDGSGVPDSSTALNYAGGTNFRSAVTNDGNSIWVTSNLGGGTALAYTTRGSSSVAPINVSGAAGFRSVTLAGSQLVGSTGSTPKGVYSISDSTGSLPEGTANPATQTLLSTTSDSASDTIFLDLSPSVPGVDTMYIAESASFNKFSLVNGAWVSNGAVAAGGYITGVAAEQQGTAVSLLYSTDAAIYKFTDGGYNTALSSTLPAAYLTPAANENFRGIAFAPTPEPGTLGLLTIGIGGLLARRRRA